MSRKPYLLKSKQGQSKRIKREMAQNHENINAGGNNSDEEIIFCHEETVRPNNENEFINSNPDSCSLPSHSPNVQQPCEARIHLKKSEESSDFDSDDEVIMRKRKTEDSDSPDDYRIVKMKKTQPSAKYPIPPKRLKTGTRNNNTEKFTGVVATSSTEEIIQNNNDNLTPGSFQIKSQSDLTNAAPDNTFTTNTVHCPSGCILSKQFATQNHLIQVVTDLSVQMNEVNKKLDLLLARPSLQSINQPDDTFIVPDFLKNLPVKDDTSFSNLNEELKINHNKQSIIKFLAGIGGRNARSLTTNILRRVLHDEVAELYSLTGKKMKNSNKKSFLRAEICKIIFEICKNIYDDVTEENLKEIISDWLNQAKVRIRRRADRQNNKESESEASGYN